MQQQLRNNQSLINISSVHSTNTSFCGPQEGHHLIVRRKMNGSFSQRRRRSGGESQSMAMRYIPLARVSVQENSISLSTSRQNSKENLHNESIDLANRKFQRNSERILHKFSSLQTRPDPEPCTVESCIQEKNGLTQNIRKMTAKMEILQKQNQRLLGQVKTGEEKIKKLEDQIKDKNIKIEELVNLITKKDQACSKLHESINEKYRQITKLEDIVCKLQKQITNSSNPQTFTPLSLESTRIINQLTSQLKCREIENHMLKKEQFDSYALEDQVKRISKENAMLKDRLAYYMRMSKNIEVQSCSSDSFSLSFSQTSPLKRSGKLRMDSP